MSTGNYLFELLILYRSWAGRNCVICLSPQDILPPAQKRKPIPPQSLRIVVDTMLQGLGQHLRCCGADVIILDNSGDHTKAVEVSFTVNNE